jgi:hypothetical protein
MHQRIDGLLKKDTEFLTLCEDHGICVASLRYWIRSKEPEAETRVNEYRSLIQELEEEIHRSLTALNPLQQK